MSRPPNAASVAIISGGAVLLVKRARAPYRHYWTLPGGRMEAGESAQACARREVAEELGLELGALVPVATVPGGADYELAVFAGAPATGVPTPSEEISAWRWVPPGETGTLRITPELPEVLARAVAALARG